ncbi:unnamed protein product, partial [Sphacelaria rigidula]
STSLARRRLTSQSGRDVVLSTWYGLGHLGESLMAEASCHKSRKRQTKKKSTNGNSARASNVVPHRSTSLARRRLTFHSGLGVVLSTWYGRS